MGINKLEQERIDKRNARSLFYDRCNRSIPLLRAYVEAKTTYDLLIRSGVGHRSAVKKVTENLGLSNKLTFSDYQVRIAQDILNGHFPELVPRAAAWSSCSTSSGQQSVNTGRNYVRPLEEQLKLL